MDCDLSWWQTAVIYQVYPRSFMDSDGDGVGDLRGITSKLEYLKWLGVDAIWLSPIYPSPMHDFGYDVSDYTEVHRVFGTLVHFDELVAQARAHGMRVLLDFVPNHTSHDHPWFIESRASRDNPKRDWYVWHNAKPDGSPPNNWLSRFGDSAWRWDRDTRQYYLHSFLPEQPDLNWWNFEARAAMHDVLRFWFDRGVAGFRIDVIEMLIKDRQLRDNPPNPDYEPGADRPSDVQLLVHNARRPEVHKVLKGIRQVADEYGETVLVGETAMKTPLDRVVSYYGSGDELHLPFNFGLISRPWRAAEICHLVQTYEAALPPGAWPNYVLGNHDRPRVATRVGGEQARLAAMLLLTLRGTPFVYYGEEIGMSDVEIPPAQVQDPIEARMPGFGRDGARTPMQWGPEKHAGFSRAELWLPVAPDYATVNVARQLHDPSSILSLYRRLIELRRSSSALKRGPLEWAPTGADDEDCLSYTRRFGEQKYLVALNFSGDKRTLSMRDIPTGEIVLSTRLDREEPVDPARLVLGPYEGCLVTVR